MRKLLVELAYNGAGFHGWQFQKNACSVAQTVQDGLESPAAPAPTPESMPISFIFTL